MNIFGSYYSLAKNHHHDNIYNQIVNYTVLVDRSDPARARKVFYLRSLTFFKWTEDFYDKLSCVEIDQKTLTTVTDVFA